MKEFIKILKPAFLCFMIMTIICGIIYTGIVTGIAQAIFADKAGGSIIAVTLKDGSVREYGSALIAQEFTEPKYMIGRPVGTTNLSPVSEEQKKLVRQRLDWWHSLDPDNKADIPADLVTASGSGADPNISPAAAEYQVARIARERNLSKDSVRDIISEYTAGRLLGFWGEPAVNVLKVNLALDGLL